MNLHPTTPATPGHWPRPSTAPEDAVPGDRRLRARWRILIAFVASLAVILVADLGVTLWPTSTTTGHSVASAGRLIAVFGVLALTARWLDRRRLRDYGLRRGRAWWIDVGFGAVVGFGIFALSAGIGIAVGWIEIRDVLSPAADGGLWLILTLATLRLVAVSLWEEVLFRGVMIRNAAESFARKWPRTRAVLVAAAISMVVFVLVHVPQNLGVEEMSLARMALLWVTLGGLLTVPYLVTGQLAIPLGLHLTINLALQHVFVTWAQQSQHTAVVLHLDASGADALAGAGGVLQVGAIGLGYLVVLGWLRWRYGSLRIHPSLTEIPAAARASSSNVPTPKGALAPPATDEQAARGDTESVVSTGCTARSGR